MLQNMEQLELKPLETHDTSWQPSQARVTINVTLDAMIVPGASGAARVDTAHLIVLDNFIGEKERKELLDFITEPGGRACRGVDRKRYRTQHVELCTGETTRHAASTAGCRAQLCKRA